MVAVTWLVSNLEASLEYLSGKEVIHVEKYLYNN